MAEGRGVLTGENKKEWYWKSRKFDMSFQVTGFFESHGVRSKNFD